MDTNLYLRYVVEFLILVPAAVIAVLPVYYSRRIAPRYLFGIVSGTLFLIIGCGAAICTLPELPSNAVIFPAMPLMFVIYSFCFNLPLQKKLFCFANSMLLCGFAATYNKFLTAPLELNNTDNVYHIRSGLLFPGIASVTGLVFAHTLYVKFPELLKNQAIDRMWKVFDAATLVTAAVVLWMKPLHTEYVMTGRLRPICLVVLLAIPTVTLFLYQMFWRLAKEMTESAELQQNCALLRMEEKQYQITYRHLMDIKELRHDFRQHLLIITEYAETGQIDKLKKYISPLVKSVDKKPIQICENQAVNAIISHYDILAKEQNVKVKWGIHLSENLPVKEADICRVIGNLLENAIHAVGGLCEKDRIVDLRAGMIDKDTLAVHITNPYEGTIQLDKEGFPIIESKNHGTGLRSVKSAAEKYNGEVIILTKNQTFEVDVLMYGEKK